MNKIIYQNDDRIYAATTMRDISCPEANNMALHVCIDPQAILQNRKQLEKETLSLDHWALPWQKHTNKSYRITKADWSKGAYSKDTSIMGVDAIYTTEPQTLIGVFTADCVGLLLIDEATPCICAIHSGWKGTFQKIGEKAAQKMIKEYGCNPQDLIVCMCPSIRKCHFEVGEEVAKECKKIFEYTGRINDIMEQTSEEKWHIDTILINRILFKNLGLKDENIIDSGLCSVCNSDIIHSFRVEKEGYGLATALIKLK